VLLILDNLDVDQSRDILLSAMLDQLVSGCAQLNVLVTSRRAFYCGRHGDGHVVYRVPDLRQSADQLFLQVGLLAAPPECLSAVVMSQWRSAGLSVCPCVCVCLCVSVGLSVCHTEISPKLSEKDMLLV